GQTLVIGGDGRYHNREAIQTAIAMAAANGVGKVVLGQGGLLSTPAASHLIRQTHAAGGMILTASHNPAGPDGDFGIKYNVRGGGQAGEGLTERIHARSRGITSYKTCDPGPIDLDRLGRHSVDGMELEIIDATHQYSLLMQKLFDFDRIRDWFAQGHRVRFDAMHAVTGPYARRILIDMLGAGEHAVENAEPLPDFGGGHPDPNLRHAAHLVRLMHAEDAPELGAASDGDGDRNMIHGPKLFISPGDSLAILCEHLHKLPGYRKGLAGVARSMPTSRALDRVAEHLGIDCYETPTGWKFFANLLDSGKISLCGEESFGTSSDHVREKDGLWAVLAWLNILALTDCSVPELAKQHWQRFGRHYYARHDYESLPATDATQVMQELAGKLAELPRQTFGDYQVSVAEEFSYCDPVDGSLAVNQGLRIVFDKHARLVLRLSGTGTQGATLRVYLERFEQGDQKIGWRPDEALAPIRRIADALTNITRITGRSVPDVVT
ncbi:MAG: alpha-D-glucose phosphate-specific phosphoglucomutase, partial [Panacagrimonas sp.]